MLFSSHTLRFFLFLFGLFAASTALSACNTMEGLGEDTETLGSEIDEEAEEAQ